MASIKELKKDIHYITNELIIECLVADVMYEGKYESKLTDLATTLLTKKKELLSRINQYRKVKHETNAKKYFKDIQNELHDLVKEILDEVQKLEK
ncbi:MAG TPA: hypothetical protein VJ937_00415 [Salinivirga sp.]|uniref:Uncharacterized protein n=1 Tax=Salinivirga cyanobacteriivorans TaxID=1307839 RepID=A0A0S2I551_9BACT|nr:MULTISPECIES: hypothetical protein [Salinivirga]ALO17333.1 hypothetical protein L21SP5_03736 [Salinivirga cyanobacteriivorans]HKK57911.1 hypothetical protein [Salinivirga sp.]